MALDKPYSFVIVFGIFAFIVLIFGLGLSDVSPDAYENQTRFFKNVSTHISSSDGLAGIRDDASLSLGAEGDSDEADTDDSLIVRGFRSMKKLGQSVTILEESVEDAEREIGLPPFIVSITFMLVIVVLFVVLYTWVRSRS